MKKRHVFEIEEKSLFSWYLYLDVSILKVYSAIVCTVKLSTSHSRLVTATHTHKKKEKKWIVDSALVNALIKTWF